MKIGLLAYELRRNGSGQSRFLINICKGLKNSGNHPVIFSLYIDSPIQDYLISQGIEYHFHKEIPDKLFNFYVITYRQSLSEKLAELVMKNEGCDVYIVMADEAIGVVNFIHKLKSAYISNGDMSLLFLNHDFRVNRRMLTYILERNLASGLRRHSNIVSKFDMILANSLFTSNLMAYLYEIPIDKVVYPPVDSTVFYRETINNSTEPQYAVAILRNKNDPINSKLRPLSKTIPLKVVGGGRLDGAENLGYVSDSELRQLYSNATINLSPNTKEYYGYSIVESMSCGTPTIAFNNGGARELIKHDSNGWLVSSINELEKKAVEIINSKENEGVSKMCIEYSKRYSIEQSTQQLLNYLREI